MDTPPHTPPLELSPSLHSLQIHYCDFAYEERGPFRLPIADIQETTAKTYADLLSGPLMDIYVGSNNRRWSLHRNLLNYHTDYFQDRVKEDIQARGGHLPLSTTATPPTSPHVIAAHTSSTPRSSCYLPDTSPSAFELLVKYLYQGSIPDATHLPLSKKWDYAESCQHLYILAHVIHLPALQNLAIDQFRKACFQSALVPGAEEMLPVYERLPKGSPMRSLISRIAARQILDPFFVANTSISSGSSSENGDSGDEKTACGPAEKYRSVFAANPDFAIDVVNAMREGMGAKLLDDPTEGEGCVYHEHVHGKKCGDKGW